MTTRQLQSSNMESQPSKNVTLLNLEKISNSPTLSHYSNSEDIEAAYHYYNHKIFGGVLPDVEIAFTKMISWAEAENTGREYTLHFARKSIARDSIDMTAILLHEMIHIWQWVTGIWVEDHDRRFYHWLSRIENHHNIKMIWWFLK